MLQSFMLKNQRLDDIYTENVYSLINDVRIAKVDTLEISSKNYLTMAHFEKHVCALQAPVNTNVKRIVTLMDAVAKLRELLKGGFLINWMDVPEMNVKLKREVQGLTSVVEMKDFQLQTMPGLGENNSRLRERFLG